VEDSRGPQSHVSPHSQGFRRPSTGLSEHDEETKALLDIPRIFAAVGVDEGAQARSFNPLGRSGESKSYFQSSTAE
jgi:hypothetical protein